MPTLEVGPGAGQATAELLTRGASPLIAVEPDKALARYLVERFGGEVDVFNVPFEEFEIAPASVSLAVSASAWHWVDQARGLSRIARFVEPGGWWAAWWTLYHDPEEPDALYKALTPLLKPIPLVSAQRKNGSSAEAFVVDRERRTAELLATSAFEHVEVDKFRWAIELDPPRARSLFGTFSPILALPPSEREDVLDRIEQVIDDEFDGLATRRCVTILYTAQRL